MASNDDFDRERFGRHVPHVLEKHLIKDLIEQFIDDKEEEEEEESNVDEESSIHRSCSPAINRFCASLLFVDISGFTALSQRLPVDELRLHINTYFKRILDTVSKHNGDVIKFAGDALFIDWQIHADSSGMTLSPYYCMRFL